MANSEDTATDTIIVHLFHSNDHYIIFFVIYFKNLCFSIYIKHVASVWIKWFSCNLSVFVFLFLRSIVWNKQSRRVTKMSISYEHSVAQLQPFNPLSANSTKWSNILKQFVRKLPTNCFSVFDDFVGWILDFLHSFASANKVAYSI